MRHAVSVASVNAAASDGSRSAGTTRTFVAGTTTSSAASPDTCSPSTRYFGQSGGSPSRQYSHSRHETPALITTVSPTRTSRTDAPTDSTTPVASVPTTQSGVSVTPGSPWRTKRSR
jgi:hypothetical protein